MGLIGFIIVILGAILFFGGTISMNRNENKYQKKHGDQFDDASKEEFVQLMNQGMRLVRWAGIFLALSGGAVVMIDYLM